MKLAGFFEMKLIFLRQRGYAEICKGISKESLEKSTRSSFVNLIFEF